MEKLREEHMDEQTEEIERKLPFLELLFEPKSIFIIYLIFAFLYLECNLVLFMSSVVHSNENINFHF